MAEDGYSKSAVKHVRTYFPAPLSSLAAARLRFASDGFA